MVPRQELLPIIGVGLRAFDIHIATAQPRVEIRKDADLQRSPLEHRLQAALGPDEGLPADAGKVEGNLCGHIVAPGVLEALNKGERIEQCVLVGRGAKREQVGQPEEFRAIRTIKAPHEGTVIVMMVCGDLLVPLPQRFGSPMRLQQLADAVAQGGFLVFRDVNRVIEHLREDREHLLFQLTMLLMQLFEPLFRRVGGVAHALEEHVDQLVPCLDLGVMEETEQETPAPGSMQNRTDIAQVEGRGLGGKLLNLGVGNAAEKGLRGDDRFQPREALRPLPEMFERRAARGVFDPRELAPTGIDGEEGIQTGLLGRAQGGRHPRIERLMDRITHMTDQTVQRLKRWQLKALLNQMLDRHINQVGGVAHGRHCLGDALLHHAGTPIRVGCDRQIAANEVPIARAEILLGVQPRLSCQGELLT